MLEKLIPAKADPILGLGKLFAADSRDNKIDLGVGVYKDADGKTPIMTAIKKAEIRLHAEQTSKSYKALAGDEVFRDEMRKLVLGDAVSADRVSTLQAPGGTGALHQLFEAMKMLNPTATIWVSNPSWPSHVAMAKHLGFETENYDYFDAASSGVDFDGLMMSLQGMQAGDMLVLHGCCHNPTGANLTADQWHAITDLVLEKNVMPLVDIAYQGFGDGLEEDAVHLRTMASRMPEMMVAASCSKNFGLYRDRVGCAMVITKDADDATVTQGNLATLNRMNYSFAPDHGAALVAIILSDADLRAEWEAELEDMRLAMLSVRQDLAEALRQQCNSDHFDFIKHHRGMFSRLGLSPEQVETLRTDHGMYIVGDSRINVPGLSGGRVEPFAKAVSMVASVSK